jgi:single-stranded-DNA-specific exonuclease
VERWTPEQQARRAYAVAGADWHEGVIGIVASRLVERCGRPVVLVSLDGERGKGSGRSVPAYDLHAGLTACAQHLERFGGHRAAAGLTIEAERLPAFAAALRAHAAAALEGRDLRRLHPVDAVVPLGELSIELARELARLEPHGLGNPAVSLLVPAAELSAVETMGDGRHVRLQVSTGAARCSGVAFGRGGDADAFRSGGRHDVLCRAEVNEWRGSASLRLLVRDVLRLPAAAAGGLGEERVAPPVGELVALAAAPGAPTVVDLRGADAALASILRCALSGEQTLVVVSDVARRAAIFETVAAPWRFGLPAAVPVSARGAAGEQAARLSELGEGPALVVADHWALARHDVLRTGFPHVVVLDPPAHPDEEAVLRGVAAGVRVELVYGEREIAFARRALDALALERLVAPLAVAAPAGSALSEAELDRLAAWPEPAPPAAVVSRAIAVLVECGAARREGEAVELAEGAASRLDPARSPVWQRAEERRLAANAHLDGLAAALRGTAVVGQARPAAV